MYAGLAVPAALTSSCCLGAVPPVSSASVRAASKLEDSADETSDLASDFEELYSEGDDGNELKKSQVC